MNEYKETVCALVVTYNRKHLLLECLEALRKQTRPIQAMYIIDNFSTDVTPQLLLENKHASELPPEKLSEPWEKEFQISNLTDGKPIKVHYVRMHENTGSAGGFHEGVKRAYEKGYDWLWLMDYDVESFHDSLENMMQFSKLGLCINSSRRYSNGEIIPFERCILLLLNSGHGHFVEVKLSALAEVTQFKRGSV